MTMNSAVRSLTGLIAIPTLSLFLSAAQAQPISITPSTVQAGTSTSLIVTSSALFINLAQVTIKQLAITPAQGVSNLSISNASAQNMVVSFTLAKDAANGRRTLDLNITDDVTVSVRFSVAGGTTSPAVCKPPCPEDGFCVGGKCIFK